MAYGLIVILVNLHFDRGPALLRTKREVRDKSKLDPYVPISILLLGAQNRLSNTNYKAGSNSR